MRKRALHKSKINKDLRREMLVSLVRAPRGNETAGGIGAGRRAAPGPGHTRYPAVRGVPGGAETNRHKFNGDNNFWQENSFPPCRRRGKR